jgi:cytochrome P450
MTFGYGPQSYIGAQLTRLEAKLAMEILLQRFERLTLREPEVDWIDSYFARGPKQLPVEFRTSRI